MKQSLALTGPCKNAGKKEELSYGPLHFHMKFLTQWFGAWRHKNDINMPALSGHYGPHKEDKK